MKKWKWKQQHIAHIILPILTLFCLAGFIGSLLFPKKVIDTYKMNTSEKEGDSEFALPLSGDTPVYYELNTGGSPMRGIQVLVSKQGFSQEGVVLRCQVLRRGSEGEEWLGELLSDNTCRIEEGDDEQYVYLSYERSEQCVGDIIVRFTAEGVAQPEQAPALIANHTLLDHTVTRVGDETIDGSLKTMYIYTHDTYPLLYDFRLMTFVLLTASMAVAYPKRKAVRGGKAR